MIEMFLTHLGTDQSSGNPLIVLTDTNRVRLLPIILPKGQGQDEAVRTALVESQDAQDGVGNLLVNAMTQSGYTAAAITLRRHQAYLYYASVRFAPIDKNNRRQLPIDVNCKLYDAIALAVRTHLPVYVSEEVISEAGVPGDIKRESEEAEKFRQFVEGAKASDFKLPGVSS